MDDRIGASQQRSTQRDIIVVGASAGGVEALTFLAGELPAALPAAIFVTLHVSPEGTSVLPKILNRNGPLHAVHPADGDHIRHGHIYVAPPDRHLIVEQGRIRTPRGPKENGFRPAIDPLFRSAAHTYGPQAVGVILSGGLDDGTLGLRVLKAAGGVAVVLDPDDAIVPSMARSAMDQVDVDHVVKLADMPGLLRSLAGSSFIQKGGVRRLENRTRLGSDGVEPTLDPDEIPGRPSDLVCPECGGTLWETQEGSLPRFRCRVGHAYGPESLMARHSESLEAAMWAAVRTLEERVAMLRRLADTMQRRGAERSAAAMHERAEEARQQAQRVREVIESLPMALGVLEGEEEAPATGTGS